MSLDQGPMVWYLRLTSVGSPGRGARRRSDNVETQLVVATEELSAAQEPPRVPSAEEWAVQQWARVKLGDPRLNARAVQIGAKMAAHPELSLPAQMQAPAALTGAYRFLDNYYVTMEKLLEPHCRQTLAAAGRGSVVLMVEDTTELDYTCHPSKTGLGPIGDGRGRGLLLHSTLAIIPETREVLGLAHAQVVLRVPNPRPHSHWVRSAESQVWEVSARSVGSPPAGVIWIHVSDQGSDAFEYMAECIDQGKHFLIRVYRNRLLEWEEGSPEADNETARALLDYARSLPPRPDSGYTVHVEATKKQPARDAQVVLQWAKVAVPPPQQAPVEVRSHAPIEAWVLRIWEPNPPEGAESVEWVLLSSLPISNLMEAKRAVDWYSCRWFCEDYHKCLKTGCRIEHSQLDDAADIRRLLGFAIPIAVRLLQLRQQARQAPELPATTVVEPLMVEVLARRQQADATMSLGEFWRRVARLGGHQGRRGDGAPGWQTIWKGWRHLSELTEGARLFVHPTLGP